MRSSLTGARRPTFRFTAITGGGASLGGLSRVRRDDGRIELSQQATIRGSGELSRAVADGAISERIKIEYVLDQGTADEQAWGLGVFYSASPVTDYGAGTETSTVEIYDGLLILHEDALAEPLHCPAGADPIAEVLLQLMAVGVSRATVAPTTKTLREAITFKAGTTRLQVVNALLDAVDYFALWCDGEGVYRVQPYVPPQQRRVEWSFLPGDDSIILDDITVESDTYAVPNRVIGISRTSGEEPALVAEQIVRDPASPFHYDRLGRWRTEVMPDLEVTSQAGLQAKVDRRLLEASTVLRKVTIRHGWVPITINSVVTLDIHGVAGRFVVINQNIPLNPRDLVSTTLKEVAQ